MRAYQCDRCGVFYGHSRKDIKKIFITDSCTSVGCCRIKDLCGECQKELEAWWNAGKAEESEETNEIHSNI